MISPDGLGRIGVLMGGYSSEREISLKSGRAVSLALKEAGCSVKDIDIQTRNEADILDMIRKSEIDVAFIALHGCLGEDGKIQSILEKAGIPYTGSGVSANQLAIDKILTQETLRQRQIPIPAYRIIPQGQKVDFDTLLVDLKGLPVVVKPASEGSSIGVTIVSQINDLPPALARAFQYGQRILVEQYIRGRELTVGILGDEALPIVEIRPKNDFFDFSAKYQHGMTEYIVPAPIPEDVAGEIQTLALAAHRSLGCKDLSRVDVMLNEQMRPFFLEINTIPGFTSTSLLPMAARCKGIPFKELCLKLVELAYEKK
ncbi:MAG: D-alanine--D-alanine ligase [Candidatus Omnitrophota bacterium]